MRIRQNAIVFFSKRKRKNRYKVGDPDFRERSSSFSLDFPPFGPLVRFGPRSKVVLRCEGYAWAPIWWSSDNSKRYESFPTCVIIWLRAM